MQNMAKKAGADTAAASRERGPMKTRHYLGDAMTALSTNILVNISGMVSYFYTDVMMMAPGMVGTVMLVSKICDAFSDIAMGAIVDRTKSKYGKARPWLIRMALPSLICLILLFAIPAGAGESFKFVYAVATNLLMIAVVYTAIMVPYGSLLSLETKNPLERAKMGIWRCVFAYLAGTAVSSLMLPFEDILGGGQRAWIIMSVVFGVVSAGSLIAAFVSVRETNNVTVREERKTSLLKGMGLLFKNKYWVIALAVNILIQIIYASGSVSAYYAKYILGDKNLTSIMGLFRLVSALIGLVLSGWLVKRLGKRNLILIGTAISVAGCALRAMNPYNLTLNLAGIAIATLGNIPVIAIIGSMVADSIEYGEWKTGNRAVGLASSSHSFGGKLASGLWAGAVGWLLGMSGYDGALAEQAPAAIRMIISFDIFLPLVCYAGIFVLMLFYRLEKDYDRITAELEARRGASETPQESRNLPD